MFLQLANGILHTSSLSYGKIVHYAGVGIYLTEILFGRKKPMTAAAFSGDGSVLAVAAEKVITLWDPDRNTLLAVLGNSLEVIF